MYANKIKIAENIAFIKAKLNITWLTKKWELIVAFKFIYY
jgi:hypothetical protein